VRLTDGLPHQVPFRLASVVRLAGDDAVEAVFLASSGDALFRNGSSEISVVEAMAQAGGVLSFRGSGVPGVLGGIDEASFSAPIAAGDRLDLKVKLVASFGRIFRFEGVAERDGVEIARARFYLAGGEDPSGSGA
jgi:hypothetical protein